MTQPARSTWPETLYALSLTKSGSWPAQRTVMDLFCAEAVKQNVFVGPIVCSHRDLASHLYRSEDSGHSAAGARMRALVERGVLRELGKGSGTAPSEWDVAHWTRWNVPWRIREASAHDRVSAFAAGLTAPQGGISGPVLVRSLAKSARANSAAISSLAGASIDKTARSSTAVSTLQVRGSRLDRYGPPLSTLSFDAKTSLSREPNEREQKLIDAFKKGGGLKKVWGLTLEQLCELAATTNGSFDEICRQAADPSGPSRFEDRLSQLRQFAETPHLARNSARLYNTPPDRVLERPWKIESNLRGLENCGEGETAEAYELRQELATLDTCEPNPA